MKERAVSWIKKAGIVVALVGVVTLIALLVVILVRGGLGDPVRETADTSALNENCTWENRRTAAKRPSGKRRARVTVTPAEGSAQRVVNIDEDRDAETLRGLRLRTNRRLPSWFERKHFEIYADPLVRTGDETLETVSFPEPMFIPPRILSDGRRIYFGVCIDPAGLPAGRYTGLVNIGGPPGLSGTTVAITANAKDSALFWRGAVIAFLVAIVTLLFRGAAEKRLELRAPPTEQNPNPKWPGWTESLVAAIGDLQFVFTSAVALATAFGALYTAYLDDPAWGATGPASVFTLVVTAFAAVGGQTLLAGLRQGAAQTGR
jgi:hypothetical protein